MNLPLMALGGWLILDGVGSIIVHESQSTVEHLVQIRQAGLGLVCLGLELIGSSLQL